MEYKDKDREDYEYMVRALKAAGVPYRVTLQILTVEAQNPAVLEPGGIDRMLKEQLTPDQYLKISGYDTLSSN